MKILILKPSSLGDVVQALPVLRLLKRHHPSSVIHWWIARELLPLLEDDPDLHSLLPFDRQRSGSLRVLCQYARVVRAMRATRFDLVIDLQGLARSGLTAWLASGGLTVGLDDSREGARGFYDIAVPRPSYLAHAVDWYLEVLRVLRVPVDLNFTWLPRREAVARNIEQKWNPGGARWILVHPGARWHSKRWPADYYQQLVKQLLATYDGANVAVLGGRDDAALGASIARVEPARCLNLAGQTSLPELVEWIRLGELMVTNDTGPMHIAAALEKPVVAMFGATEPRRTGPYRQVRWAIRRELPCAPCFKASCSNPIRLQCLQEITPDAVLAQAVSRLKDQPHPLPSHEFEQSAMARAELPS